MVRLEPRADPPGVGDEPHFRHLVRGLFTHRRKTLRNAAAALPPWPGADPARLANRVLDALEELRISPTLRPEALSPDDFAALSRLTSPP